MQPYFTWSPNFYIIFVAKPGIATKSTSINNGAKLLREVPGIKFGPDAITWQALISSLAESKELVPLPDGSFEAMSCLTFTSSEFGSLVDLQDRQMVNILVDLWDGKDGGWKKATKTQGNDTIDNPWLNIMAATTPSWLSDNLPRQMMGGGFTSRCIFVFAEKKRSLVAYPSRLVTPGEFSKLQDDLVHDLEQISLLHGEVHLTEEAFQFGEIWYQDHYRKVLAGIEDASGYMARKQAHMHKLAIVLSASSREDLIITDKELAVADKILEALEADMGRVFQLIQTTEPMEKVSRLIEIVRGLKSVNKAELYRTHFINSLSWDEFATALRSAINAGHVVEVVRGQSMFIEVPGKPVGTPGKVGSATS